jgi:hypothetical protein
MQEPLPKEMMRSGATDEMIAGWVMPIKAYIDGKQLEPGQIDRLNQAFAHALGSLHLVDRNDPICAIVARKIIAVSESGEDDPIAISETAVRELGFA